MYKKLTTSNKQMIDSSEMGQTAATSSTISASSYGVSSGSNIIITSPATTGTSTGTTITIDSTSGGSISGPYYNTGVREISALEKYFQSVQYNNLLLKERITKLRVLFQSLKKEYFNPGSITEHMFSDKFPKRQAAKELVEEMDLDIK